MCKYSLTHNKENPPQPVLAVKISREVGRKLFNHREKELSYIAIKTTQLF